MDIVTRFNDRWLFLAVLSVIRGWAGSFASQRMLQTRQSTVRANYFLCRVQRVAFEKGLSAFKDNGFGLNTDVFEIIRVPGRLSRCLWAESGGFFLRFLSGYDHCRTHASNLLVAMNFVDDIVDDIIERIVKDVAGLSGSDHARDSSL